MACAVTPGVLLWLRQGRGDGFYTPEAIAGLFSPNRLLLVDTRHQVDLLAVAEEALKDGAVGLVVAELTQALNLREGRRLSLAAKAGKTTALCLIPDGMGSNVAQTRWHCTPLFDAEGGVDSTLMRWEIKKNKLGTLGAWNVGWDAKTHRLRVVSTAGL